ncbi:MAG: uracil-DNA glycosylase [Melioribacteraceae bacterium]|nr:uracil-DNA glycosylase [Melioribacteraceae bacterium]
MEELKKQLIELLKDQQLIFGDDLFENINLDIYEKPKKELAIKFVQDETIEKNKELNLIGLTLEEFQKAENLEELNSLISNCQLCPLGKTRNKFVFGVGNPNANAMLIGEAPGADEDLQGEPFVGRAGKLLTDILKAINFTRDEVYIANILKCRPPGNRDPLPSEMETCMPYLLKQIELIKPKVILCLGRIAANGLLNKKLTLSALRENVYDFYGIKVVVTYHPAALLRNPNWKKGCWEDVKKFRKLYDELTA